jgi:glycerol-3-phosphate acyltransferase PlsY
MEHGRIAIAGRTLEGSLGYFLACALAGALWSRFVSLTMLQVLVGSAAAALTEALPVDLDDNFTVPLISGAVMTVPTFFGVPGF